MPKQLSNEKNNAITNTLLEQQDSKLHLGLRCIWTILHLVFIFTLTQTSVLETSSFFLPLTAFIYVLNICYGLWGIKSVFFSFSSSVLSLFVL